MFFPIEKTDQLIDKDKIDDEISAILSKLNPEDPPFLSTVLIHAPTSNTAVQLMESLAKGIYPFKWRILVLRGEFGEELAPGDSVTREIPINRVKRNGDLVTPRELSIAKKDGSYASKYILTKSFVMDSKGCIECGYDDAVYFLNNWGYNKKTNTAVTRHPEYSYEPVDMRDPSKGQKRHVRYWRYAEMDKGDYARLPDLSKGGSSSTDLEKRKGK